MHHATLGLWAALSVAALAQDRAAKQPAASPVLGVVFEDRNADGVRQAEEPPVPSIRVSNGVAVTATDGEGRFAIEAPAGEGPVFLIREGTWRPTTPWFLRPAGEAPLAFGLERRAPEGDPAVLVHAAGLALADDAAAERARTVIADIAGMARRPWAVLATGFDGPGAETLRRTAELPVEGIDLRGTTRSPRYAFDTGAWLVVLLDAPSPEGLAFLEAFLAGAPEERPLAVVLGGAARRDAVPLPRDRPSLLLQGSGTLWRDPSAQATPPLLVGGADRSPRGFRVLRVAEGAIVNEVRSLGSHRRASLLWPQAGGTVPRGVLDLRAHLEDSFADPVRVTVRLRDGAGHEAQSSLARAGGTLWRATVDVTPLAPGACETVLLVEDDRGHAWETRNAFGIAPADHPPRVRTGADWPTERGDARGSSIAATALAPPLRPAWSTWLGGEPVRGSAVVASGRVVAAVRHRAGAGDLVALDAVTGALAWRASIDGGPASAPIAFGRDVLVLMDSGALRRFDVVRGATRPTKPEHVLEPPDGSALGGDATLALAGEHGLAVTDSQIASFRFGEETVRRTGFGLVRGPLNKRDDPPQPTVFGDLVALPEPPGVVVRHVSTLERAWTPAESLLGARSATFSESGALFAVVGGTLRRIDVTTGETLWESPVDLGGEAGAPVLAGDFVVVTAPDARLVAFDAKSGGTRWSWRGAAQALDAPVPGRPEGRAIGGTPVVAGHHLWFGANDGRLYAVDARSGITAWWARVGSPIAASLALSGNALFAVTRDGCLHAFAP